MQKNDLAECSNSIFVQTFINFEIICINDGSTDNSAEISAKYKSKDNRLKVIAQKNQGVVAVRNNAIENAKSEFIYTLDSDDVVEETIFEKSHNVTVFSKEDAITCRVATFGQGNREMKLPYPNKKNMAC